MAEQHKPLDTVRDESLAALSLADTVINKTYLQRLNELDIIPVPEALKKINLCDIAQFFKVERFVSEKNENSRDKLVSVFHAAANCGGSVLILIHSDGKKIGYYFGTKTLGRQDPDILSDSVESLEKTLKGNFPGTKIKKIRHGLELDTLLRDVFENKQFEKEAQEKHICAITGVAGLRSAEESRDRAGGGYLFS